MIELNSEQEDYMLESYREDLANDKILIQMKGGEEDEM